MAEIIYLIQPVMNALYNRLSSPDTIALFDAVTREFQSNVSTTYVRKGRAKVQDTYPCIALEIGSKKEEWGAINYTKDITVNVDIYGMIKVSGGAASEKLSLATEDYIIKFGDLLHGILNERGKQQYNDIDGKGAKIYDSFSSEAAYTYLYQGAVRAVKIPWFAKLWLRGSPPGAYES